MEMRRIKDMIIDSCKIFRYSSAPTKIHARGVCKQWFNYLNDEEIWNRSCKQDGFVRIPRLSWMQVSLSLSLSIPLLSPPLFCS